MKNQNVNAKNANVTVYNGMYAAIKQQAEPRRKLLKRFILLQ